MTQLIILLWPWFGPHVGLDGGEAKAEALRKVLHFVNYKLFMLPLHA